MASTYQIDPNDLERLRSDPKRLRRDLKQLRSDLKQLRSTDQAERQDGSRGIARLFQSDDPRVGEAICEGLFSEVMPIVVGKLKFLKSEYDRDHELMFERLEELVQRTLIQVWLGRIYYDPGHCDLGAWMLCHARIVWGKMRAEEAKRSRTEEA
jgi:hypothetical protein